MTDSDLTAIREDAAAASQQSGDEAIVVRLGAGRFAIVLAAVVEVGRLPAVTRVPGMPGWLAGVANWRGRILPVLDLRPLLGADAAAAGTDGRLVIVGSDAMRAGMIVDSVAGTTGLSDVAPFPAAAAPPGSALLAGQVVRADGPLAVLDVAAVLRLRDGLPRGRRTA